MADFIDRLAERTLGVAPVVQPLISSVFAPEPTSYSLDLEWDSEAPASSGDLDRPQGPPAMEMPAERPEAKSNVWQEDRGDLAPDAQGHFQEETSDVHSEPHQPGGSASEEQRGAISAREDRGEPPPPGVPERPRRTPDAQPEPTPKRGDEAVSTSPRFVERGRDTSPAPRPSPDARAPSEEETPPVRDAPMERAEDTEEDYRSLPPATPERAPEDRPDPSHPREAGSLERSATPGTEDRRDPPRTTSGLSQAPPETRSEALRRAEPEPARHGDLPAAQRVLSDNVRLGPSAAEDAADRTNPRLLRPLVGHEQGATLSPRPSPGTQASPDATGATIGSAPDHPAPPDAPPVAPGTVRPRINIHGERDSREPRVAAPESSAPTIHVAIGRLEVRATTPPPPMPPERWTVPDPPGPVLSLDDYLKQRNGGQR